jgi:hypothetical protein
MCAFIAALSVSALCALHFVSPGISSFVRVSH